MTTLLTVLFFPNNWSTCWNILTKTGGGGRRRKSTTCSTKLTWYWHQSWWWRYHFMKLCNQQAQRLYMIFHILGVLFPHAGKQTVSRILLRWKVWIPTRYKSTKFTCMCQLQKWLFTFLCSSRHSCKGRIILEATFSISPVGFAIFFMKTEDHDSALPLQIFSQETCTCITWKG